MTLRFMLVQDTAHNKQELYADVHRHLTAAPGNRVFYVVPNHMKFEMELQVLKEMKQFQAPALQAAGLSGMMRLQVFSFQRLAWYLLPEQTNPAQNALSEVGLTMLLHKILLDMQDELVIYRSEFNRLGFVQELATLFQELEIGNVDSACLNQVINHYGEQDSALIANQLQKIRELTQIYARYEEKIVDQSIQKQEIYRLLQAAIREQDLSDVLVVIDGFYRFNANELATIKELLQAAAHVEVVLSLDQAYPEQPPAWHELFTITGRTYHQLFQVARQEKLPLWPDRYALPTVTVKPGFQVLEQTLRLARQSSRPLVIDAAKQAQVQQVLAVWKCETPFIEAEQVANQIYQLVSEQGYRYQDIQILTRDIKQYKNQLIPHLERNNIPYFIDDAESMEGHPLFRFLDSLYRIYKYNWRYQDIFNLLRSELLVPPFQSDDLESWEEQIGRYREIVDRTENVVIKNGYEGQRWWRRDSVWSYLFIDENGEKVASARDIETEQIANRLKAFVVGALTPLFDQLAAGHLDTQSVLRFFFEFLEANGIPKQLMQWRDQQIANNRLEEARNHEQAWQTFVALLDEYVQLFGQEAFDAAHFSKLLTIAFETATFSIVPPTIDSVTIAGIDSQRVEASKITFVLGLTRTALPKQFEEHSLLTTEDRELVAPLLEWHQAFEPSASIKASNEHFIAYKTFLSATDRLYLCYPYNQMNEKESVISPFVAQLINWFDLQEVWKTDQHHTLSADETLILGNWRSQMHHLTMKLALAQADQAALPAQWQPVYQQLIKHREYAPALQKLLTSISYTNHVTPLSAEQAHALYGSPLQVSVSQLEMYNRDPFSYFLKYGLKLRERPVFELDAAQTGSYYHDVLQFFFDAAMTRKLKVADLSPKQIDDLLQPIFTTMQDANLFPQYSIFAVNAQHQYLQQQINQTLRFMIKHLANQKRVTKMETIANELNFGGLTTGDQNANLQFALADGTPVRLRGRIDRLDHALVETAAGPAAYLQIVDYKSGRKSISFNDIYHGTNLQLYTYLMVALKHYRDQPPAEVKRILPLGAFYTHVHEPIIKIANQADLAKLTEKQLTKEFKLNGFVLADLDVLPAIDPEVDNADGSLVYPYKLKKDGTFYSQSSILTLAEFDQLLSFNEQKIVETASQIMSGNIQLAPYDDDRFVPAICEPYRSVSQFDVTDIFSHYRRKRRFDKPEDFFGQLTIDENEDIHEGNIADREEA